MWLHENIQVLGDALGMRFADPQREVSVGSFTVDLVAEEESLGRIVIENQLEATDHDHLGKVLTYLTNLEAKTAIWVSPKPRPEHVRAVTWLNETTPDDVSFYLVQLAAFRIGTSAPAPLFTVIAGPSAEGKGFGQQKKQLAERHLLRLKFLEGLLALAKHKGVMTHASRSPGKEFWIGGASGREAQATQLVGSVPASSLAVDALPNPAPTCRRLKDLYNAAQADPHYFALVYEQRRTTSILIAGFRSLGTAIEHLGQQIDDRLVQLTASVECGLSQLESALASAARASGEQAAALRAEVKSQGSAISEQLQRDAEVRVRGQEDALRRLDNLQRGRRPGVWERDRRLP